MSPPIQSRKGKSKKPGKVVPVAATETTGSPIPSSSPSSSSSSSSDPSTASAAASESEEAGMGMEIEEEQGEEEEVYGLDGRVIDKSTRGPSLKKGSDREKIEDKRDAVRGYIQGDDVDMGKMPGNKRSEDVLKPGMSLRGGSRGVPIPVPAPSLNLLRSLNGQLDSLNLNLNLEFPLPNPLLSLERWSKYLFTPKGEKKQALSSVDLNHKRGNGERKHERETRMSDNEDEEESEDGFDLIDDIELDPGGRGEAENGSGSRVYTRSFWSRADLAGHQASGTGSGSGSMLAELHPDSSTALRVWDCTGLQNAGVPGEGDVKGSVVWENSPKEVFSWATRRGDWILDTAFIGAGEDLRMIRLVLSTIRTGRGEATVKLEIVDPSTGEAESTRDCGQARNGRLLVSNKHIVAALAGKVPSISFFTADTLEPLCRSINEDVGVNTRSGLPVIALQGRLLAYVTSDGAKTGVDRYNRMEEARYGNIVTQRSVKAAHEWKRQMSSDEGSLMTDSSPVDDRYSPESLPSMQAMVMSTAAGISSEVAKGVWSGLKGFGKAAMDGASRSETLSKSAPVVSEFAKRFSKESSVRPGSPETHKHMLGNSQIDSETRANGLRSRRFRGASWIKIVDLGRLVKSRRPVASEVEAARLRPSLVAHFALPVVENVSLPGHELPVIDIMAFSPVGTHLAIGTSEGKIVSVVEIRSSATIGQQSGNSNLGSGQVWLRGELKRGVTPARISQLGWDLRGDRIAVTTRNTSHVFPVGSLEHRPGTGSGQLALSAKLSASVKIRPSEWIVSEPERQDRPRPKRSEASLLQFIPHDSTTQAQHSVILYDPLQRTLGKVSVFKLSGISSDKQEHMLPMATALWRLPKDIPVGQVKRESPYGGQDHKVDGKPRHPFAQVEIVTFSPHDVPPSIYKDRMFTFSTWSSCKPDATRILQFRKQVEVLGQGDLHHIENALSHNLDISTASPIVPALPNGNYNGDKSQWRVQPIRVMASAVKNRRSGRQQYGQSDKQLEHGQDTDGGFLVDLSHEGPGSPLSLEISQEESWEDDLIAGAMDD